MVGYGYSPSSWQTADVKWYTGGSYANTVSVWINNVRKEDFTLLGWHYGPLDWGTERDSLTADSPGGSFASCQYFDGSSWNYISYGQEDSAWINNDTGVHFTARLLYSNNKAMFESN